MEQQPKFPLPEIIIVGIFIGIFEILDIISFGIPFTDLIAFPALQIYLIMKGARGGYLLSGNILELFPIVDFLPLRLATFLLTAWLENHPSLERVTSVALAQPTTAKAEIVVRGAEGVEVDIASERESARAEKAIEEVRGEEREKELTFEETVGEAGVEQPFTTAGYEEELFNTPAQAEDDEHTLNLQNNE